MAATVVFVATSLASCGGVFQASSAIFFPEQTDFPGGVPPRDFVVVVEDRAIGDMPYRTVRWHQVADVAAKNPRSLRLSVREYSWTESDPWGFKVTEETPAHQVVSVSHRNTAGIETRYRVEGPSVTPLSYKSDGGVQHMMLLLPVFALCLVLAWFAARFTARRLQRSRAGS